ncbi:MAG: hypothetical protein K6L81_16100 [Agarilytica sp.]
MSRHVNDVDLRFSEVVMGWSLSEGCKLRHTNGAKITLVSGTWQRPQEIYPKIPDFIEADDQARLIRQGIGYARQSLKVNSPGH